MNVQTNLPWLRSHGPIEASPPSDCRGSGASLPWLRSHGPIEARSLPWPALCWRPFRGCEATAPLKHVLLVVKRVAEGAFRGCEATAPLKRRHPCATRLSVTAFRGCEATAPLKPVQQLHQLVTVRVLPWLRSHGPIEARSRRGCGGG